MRPLTTFSITALLACGPITAPPEDATTTTTATSEPTTTDTAPGPTTTTSPPFPTTTELTSTTDIPTNTATTLSHDFIALADLPSDEDCDTFAQNCPDGEKCVPWASGGGGAWDSAKCVNVTGDGAPGEPCTAPQGGVAGIDDCAFGSICWNVDENKHGTCVAQCTGTGDHPVCPPAHDCYIAALPIINLCFPWCHPLLDDCGGTDLCIPNGDSFVCVLDASGDEGQTNDPCEFANSCDKGLFCLASAAASAACDPQANGCCQPFCQLPDGPCPNPDQLCLPWYDPMLPIPPGYEDLGFCAIPE